MKKIVNGVVVEVDDREYYEEPTPKEVIVDDLKQKLTETDSIAIDYADGLLTEEEYEPIRLQRIEWRNQINQLESEGETDG